MTIAMTSNALIACVLALVPADDVVKVKGSTISYRGEIVRWDEAGVALKWGRNQEVKEFSRDQIERVETKWPAGFEAGQAALSKGDFNEASVQLRNAVRVETRRWAQDMAKALLLRALDGLGDVDSAAALFVELAPNRADAGIMAFAPFRWTNDEPLSEQRRATARAWLLQNEEPIVKLLAANWLIDGPDREQAAAALDKLLTDPDSRIRPIARAILLRVQLEKNAKAVTKEDLAEYRAEVAKLPNPVRVGPQFVLGLATDALGDPVDAALAYLYIPFVTSGPTELQAEALERAAKACRRAKLTGDATKLQAELKKKFPTSPAAKRSKSTDRARSANKG